MMGYHQSLTTAKLVFLATINQISIAIVTFLYLCIKYAQTLTIKFAWNEGFCVLLRVY